MAVLHRILCPTDFSVGANLALEHALELARNHQAALQVMHVVVMHDHDPHQPSHYLPDPAATRTRLQERAEAAMQEALVELGAQDLSVETVHGRGLDAAEIILGQAEQAGTDLVVLGAPRRRGSRPLRLGNVTYDVIRRAPCSVLTVRQSPAIRPPDAWRRVLVALDFSHQCEPTLRLALGVAPAGATLHLVHVIAPFQRPGAQDLEQAPLDRVEAQQQQAARSALLRYSAEIRGDRHPVQIHSVTGPVAVSLLDFLEDHEIDLAILGAQGDGSQGRFPLGSVAERVARNAACPVLIVRPSDA